MIESLESQDELGEYFTENRNKRSVDWRVEREHSTAPWDWSRGWNATIATSIY